MVATGAPYEEGCGACAGAAAAHIRRRPLMAGVLVFADATTDLRIKAGTLQAGPARATLAGAPVTDWRYYDTIYEERYMGLPQQSPEAYRQGSAVNFAAGLRGNLLIVHGTITERRMESYKELPELAGRPNVDTVTYGGRTESVIALLGIAGDRWEEHARATGDLRVVPAKAIAPGHSAAR